MQTEAVREQVVRALKEGADLRLQLLSVSVDAIIRAGTAMARSLRLGGKLLLFGNGGSAADAQHIAAEFVGRFVRDRVPLPAVALTTDTSALTAISNDYGFDEVFARQVRALGTVGDVAIAISTSGRSPNVLAGLEAARERGLSTIGLTGGYGEGLAMSADIPIVVPSTNTARIQECHIAIGHILCEIVETCLFGETWSPDDPKLSIDLQPSVSRQKFVDWDTLLALREQWRSAGRTVVWTNGCFDLLHVGHVRSLVAARRLGDVLIVGVNSDESVRRLKGPDRPLIPVVQRVEILAAFEDVDYLVVFDEMTSEIILSRLRPDVHCKRADYEPPRGKPAPEAGVVESYGGRIVYLPLVPSASSSELLKRIRTQGGGPSNGES